MSGGLRGVPGWLRRLAVRLGRDSGGNMVLIAAGTLVAVVTSNGTTPWIYAAGSFQQV